MLSLFAKGEPLMIYHTLQKVGAWILNRHPFGILVVSSYLVTGIIYSSVVIAHNLGYSQNTAVALAMIIMIVYVVTFVFVYVPCYESYHKAIRQLSDKRGEQA
jgi:hypothetical protein